MTRICLTLDENRVRVGVVMTVEQLPIRLYGSIKRVEKSKKLGSEC